VQGALINSSGIQGGGSGHSVERVGTPGIRENGFKGVLTSNPAAMEVKRKMSKMDIFTRLYMGQLKILEFK
jgi:hypothetical protein